MIELNLLPKELRKRKQTKKVELNLTAAKIPAVLIAVCVLLFLLGVHIILLFFGMEKRALSRTMTQQWDYALTQRQRADEVNSKLEALQMKLPVIRRIMKPSLDWEKLLSGLNQSVIQGVWLSYMDVNFTLPGKTSVDAPASLVLEGYALGGSEQATSLVAKLIASLKTNPDFSSYFDDVELVTLQSREFANEEVMQFKLECKFTGKRSAPEGAAVSGIPGQAKK